MCGHLCLFVLKSLASGEKFQMILNHMQHYGVDIHKVIGKIPFKPKRGFVLLKHHYTGCYNPLHLPREEPYNAVDAISMCHICYRDNEAGKPECDRKMLVESNALTPWGRREKVDRQLVRGIIGLKHRLGMDIWSNQLADDLHKPVRKRFQKCSIFAKQVDDIWTADLVDMPPYSRSNSGYKYLLIVIDVFSKYSILLNKCTKETKVKKEYLRNINIKLISDNKTFGRTVKPNFTNKNKTNHFS